MLKKTIAFKDLEGNEVTEEFYFNLSKAELIEKQFTLDSEGGWVAVLERIAESKDGAKIIAAMKELIVESIGRRSEDGRRFEKSPEITANFMQSDAYSVFLMELVTDADAAIDFARGIMPVDLDSSVKSVRGVTDLSLPPTDEVPAWIAENREPTKAELQSMTPDQLREAYERKTRPKE